MANAHLLLLNSAAATGKHLDGTSGLVKKSAMVEGLSSTDQRDTRHDTNPWTRTKIVLTPEETCG